MWRSSLTPIPRCTRAANTFSPGPLSLSLFVSVNAIAEAVNSCRVEALDLAALRAFVEFGAFNPSVHREGLLLYPLPPSPPPHLLLTSLLLFSGSEGYLPPDMSEVGAEQDVFAAWATLTGLSERTAKLKFIRLFQSIASFDGLIRFNVASRDEGPPSLSSSSPPSPFCCSRMSL